MMCTELDNSSEDNIFKDLLSYSGQGRIYIRFLTHQTTGCCSQFAARVIPTVCIFIGIFIKLLLLLLIFFY